MLAKDPIPLSKIPGLSHVEEHGFGHGVVVSKVCYGILNIGNILDCVRINVLLVKMKMDLCALGPVYVKGERWSSRLHSSGQCCMQKCFLPTSQHQCEAGHMVQ